MPADPQALIEKIRALPADRPSPNVGEVRVGQWQAAGPLRPSVVKPVFATLEAALIIRQIGALSTGDRAAFRKAIGEILG